MYCFLLVCEHCGKGRESQKCYTAEEFNVVVSAPSTPILIIYDPSSFIFLTYHLHQTDELQKKLFSGLSCHQLNFSADLFYSSRLKKAKWRSMASTPGEKDTFSNQIKPHAMGRNFAGRQIPTFLDVTCRVRLHTVLHVVACCWELLRKV